jgi:selT/selW/selH-like putative selenoprotein
LAEEIKRQFNEVNIDYIKSSGGVFEVLKDGNLIFSKRREGRFPDTSEILKKLV